MFKNLYTFLLVAVFSIATTTLLAQSTAGPIQITSFADSTNVTAGDNFPYVFQRGETINIKGAYGLTAPNGGVAKEAWVTYDVYAADWSGVVYSARQNIANDTVGSVDGNIDFNYVLDSNAAYFGQFHDSTDPTNIKNAFYIFQARVRYDPHEDTFWNIFIEVENTLVGTRKIKPMLQGLNIFPNPAYTEVNITTKSNGAKNVQVFDMMGRRVIERMNMTDTRLDVSNLGAGTYILRVEEDGKVGGQKLIIQK